MTAHATDTAVYAKALRRALLVGMKADTTEQREDLVLGHFTMTRADSLEITAIRLVDDFGKVIATLYDKEADNG